MSGSDQPSEAAPEPAQQRPRTRRAPVPALAADPVLERLDAAPVAAPYGKHGPHDDLRRQLLATPGQWIVLATRTPLREATARRLARAYTSARPARLDPTATGRYLARPFTRDGTWLVAVTYQTPGPAADTGATDGQQRGSAPHPDLTPG